ncbi:hypothetical protein CLOSBL3_11529 [Clostridiaceae bacterium BL-3]|nr:hypothetical protein CLOSBL3_11529 [Clostridiaceae bacterium BL-3]
MILPMMIWMNWISGLKAGDSYDGNVYEKSITDIFIREHRNCCYYNFRKNSV